MSNVKIKDELKIEKGRLYPLGVYRIHTGLSIVSDVIGKNNSGIILYPPDAKEIKIPFTEEYRMGDLYALYIPHFPYQTFAYTFYRDDKPVADSYARLVDSSKRFGDPARRDREVKNIYQAEQYDWGTDRPLEIPFHETILYKLHMRGFTKHASSGVKERGTFAGLTEKIPYLKELGITAIECMPIYDFDDVIYNPAYSEVDQTLLPYMDENQKTWKHKTNYWGYCAGNYMAPKRAYAAQDRPDVECKDMIKVLHQNGIEVILEFYFPVDIRPGFILDVCHYWMENYHVDGFKLMGCEIPVRLLATDPYLKKTKLIFEALGNEDIRFLMEHKSDFKNLAVISPGFMYDIRKFLKGDEDMLSTVAGHFRTNPAAYAVVNEITSYQGFTLADLVSYDRKHNEANGEDNRDGSDYNYSWNCGIEGRSRRKSVVTLRNQQSKNALMMLLLSQGTPLLLAGDEFGNSAEGNNNPYCQDNAVSWLNWKMTKEKTQLQKFVTELIAFRKKHPILHMEEQLRQVDYASCGYPDISYHGEQAWYSQFANYNRHMGIMYCGKYAKVSRNQRDVFIYVAYNAHWIEHEFALPKLPDGMQWKVAIVSGEQKMPEDMQNPEKSTICIMPRTIVVLTGEE